MLKQISNLPVSVNLSSGRVQAKTHIFFSLNAASYFCKVYFPKSGQNPYVSTLF